MKKVKYVKIILGIPCILAVNKYDLVEELEKEGKELEDYMQKQFLDVFAKKNGFIGAKRISARYFSFWLNFRFNDGYEEILSSLVNEIIKTNTTINPETGEMELRISKMKNNSFVLSNQGSILYDSKQKQKEYSEFK